MTFPPGRTMLSTNPVATASPATIMTMGIAVVARLAAWVPGVPWVSNDVDLEPDQLRRQRGKAIVPALRPPVLDDDVLALHVAEVAKPLTERLELARVSESGGGSQKPDPGGLGHLLRVSGNWADGSRAPSSVMNSRRLIRSPRWR